MPDAGGCLRRPPPAGRGAGRRLRALRLLPADLPDLRAVGRGDGLPARPHLPDEARARGRADDATRWSQHFDACLGCMACVTACPSGVQYDKLIEATRAQVERRHDRPPADRALRGADLRALPLPARLRLLRGPLRGLPAAPACDRLVRRSRPAGRGWRRSSPRWSVSRRRWAGAERPAGADPGRRARRRAVVGLLTGCVQRRVLPRRQRGDGPGARGGGLRRRHPAAARAAAARCRCTTAARPRRRPSPAGIIDAFERRPASSASSSTPPAAARR